MDVPPSNFRQPPDGHESPDYVEKPTLRNYSEEKYKVEEKKYQGLGFDRYLSSSNCDLRPKSLCNDDENVYIPRSNLLYMQSQSLIDMSIYSKEKGSSQSKRLSKLKGLVIPEAPETNSFNQINIPEIKSINPLSVDIETNQKETSSVSEITTQAPSLSSIISQSWMTSTNLPKYSPAFKRKSLKVLATNLNKQTDLYSEESSYEDYVSSTQSRHSDELKSLESISSPTRSDFNFDYRTSKMMTIKDNKDHLDSDNDSAVSSSLSSLNSRASPPPSFPNNDKLNTTNNVNVIIKKATDHAGEIVGERRNSRIEITNKQTSDPVTLQIAEKNENIVLKNVHVPILVNEPVVLEFVKHRIQPSQIEISGNLDTKPVPSKRTFVPSNPPPLRPPTVPPPQPPAVPSPKLPTVLPPQPPIVKERKTITEKTESKTNYFTNNKNDVKYFEKKQTQASVQSLKANFERRESSESILPIKPKPAVTIRKKSDETVVLKEQKSVKKEMYDEPVSKVENRRSLLNSRTSKNIVKEQKRPTSIEVISDALPISHHVEYVTVELTVNPADVPLGINITGGSDQEDKNIMINRIRYGSIAYKDGRLKKGDKIICINGQSTNGMTNEDAKNLLTEKCTNFSIIIEESNDLLPFSPISRKSTSLLSLSSETKDLHVGADFENKKPTHSVSIIKDSAGLGFSIEGGKDSPKGDVPLVIKKIFAGGVADKCGELRVGDEIVAINGINLQNLSRIEAWSQMKKLPDGSIKIDIFR